MELAGTYLVNTSDLDEAATILGPEYGRMTITRSATDSQPWLRIWRTLVGSMTLDDLDMTSDACFELAEPEGIVLCRIRAGAVEFHVDDCHIAFERGDLVAVAADGAKMMVVMRDARCDLISFSPSLLAEMGKLEGATPCGTPLNRFSVPASQSAGQQVADVIDHIRRFIANNPLVERKSLVSGSAARYLIATILAAFPAEVLES
ncbi:hypothetical protein [Mycobacterium sp. 236(2023)]|uniref:hypothetical protein n=1 Tax=Mycobacterium sp. 236(2023) TaxID=3038163 RepID=UPI002414DB98|nr:hypothetical protein [Mycobacterium sp. 236(2023)]MDG4668613.1 hypothetical protein [Mycobacterium sp. 236(2023)]